MHGVFLSHASKDKAIADAVCHALEATGTRCWVAPRDVRPGVPYARCIMEAIESCSIMLVVISEGANASDHVAREVELAARARKPLLPVRIQDVAPNKEFVYFMGREHWLDAITPPIEAHLGTIIAAAQGLVPAAARPAGGPVASSPAGASPPPPTPPRPAVPAPTPRAKQPRWSKLALGAAGSLLLAALIVAVNLMPGGGPPTPKVSLAEIAALKIAVGAERERAKSLPRSPQFADLIERMEHEWQKAEFLLEKGALQDAKVAYERTSAALRLFTEALESASSGAESLASMPRPVPANRTVPDVMETPEERRGSQRGGKRAEPSKLGDTMTNSIGAVMVFIPPGAFTMGTPQDEEGRYKDETQHQVTLTRGFWLGKTEVTQAQWQTVMGKNPSKFKGDNNRPVENVSWNDCVEFCKKLSAKEGKRYRLPTEAEWEYACRAGSTTPFHTGATITTAQANFDGQPYGGSVRGENRKQTVAVASLSAPNAWGLHDMHGNVTEWCADWYATYEGDTKSNSADDATDPKGPDDGELRVFRGGSMGNGPILCRAGYRRGVAPQDRDDSFGLRLALDSD